MSGAGMGSSSWIAGTFNLLSSTPYSAESSKSPNKSQCSSSARRRPAYCKFSLPANDLKFVLHDALQSSGLDTTHARGFQRSKHSQVEQRSLYLHSVLTHRSGSASMLSLIYSEVLKMLRLWGMVNFDVEVFFPHDSHSSPRGYHKQKSREGDQLHIMTSQSLLVEILKDLKNAFWPFQHDPAKSLFFRAAQAANCDTSNSVEESALKIASAKAAQHRLLRGVWTSVQFGDMRRALAACERLILLETDPIELRDYGVLLYHCGFYEMALQYLKLFQDIQKSSKQEKSYHPSRDLEEEALEKLIIRLKLIKMEEDWSRPSERTSFLSNNSEPW
ncbi:uncharacterized protein [Coffea arabica]|uniref:Uncharacterized protein isoform X2 n=1 Tax=Coffea arabica TaxID=13443 RepID=A0ABM4WJV1_COFAR